MTDIRAQRRLARARRLLVELSGRSARQTVGYILVHIDIAAEGAELAAAMASGRVPTDRARELMSAVERRGDVQRAQLVQALTSALTTPIDREDLFRLSRSVDDVLDNLRDFVRESDLYQPALREGMMAPIQTLEGGLQSLRLATAAIVEDPSRTADFALIARSHCNRVRNLYQTHLGELFRGELTMEVLKTRELLRRLDVAALRLGEAADALSDGVLKRSL